MRNKKLDEYGINLLDFSKEENYVIPFYEIGYIDAELIKTSEEKRLPIISTDKRTLQKYARDKDVDVLILQDLLYSAF